MITNSEAIDRTSTPRVKEIVNKSNNNNLSEIEIVYTSLMCFVTNCLSSITLEVGIKSQLGNSVNKSTTFNFFRRSYNLRINILLTNIISGFIATVMLTLGNKYKYPYLYIPWLLNTIKNMAIFQGPTLLRTVYRLIPYAEVPAKSFLFITLLLFIEEIFLWNDVFWSLRQCWIQYEHRKKRTVDIKAEEKSVNEKRKQLPPVNKTNDINFKFGKVDNSQVPFENDDVLSKLLCASTRTNSSNDSIDIKLPNSNTDNQIVCSKFKNLTE